LIELGDAMTLAIATEPVPLRTDADGSVRVGNSRVLLDVIIAAFRHGASPEQIVDQYPSLDLVDAYAVIAFYLGHTKDVDAFLEERTKDAEQIRSEIEAKQGSSGIRDRLMARYRARQSE
jgi:uncharacterized protein (DUF433 family)